MGENVRISNNRNLKFLKRLKTLGEKAGKLPESIEYLQAEAAADGLDEETLTTLIDVLTDEKVRLNATDKMSLIKSMIPKGTINFENVKSLVLWFLSNLPSAKTSQLLLQWFIGCWEYQLISKDSIYIFYDSFFYLMLRRDKEQSRLAKLIYLITKPEDVTRRQVTRIMNANKQFKTPRKYFVALLSLFKSYKPEVVPEQIPAINVQSVWGPINMQLLIGFEKTRDKIISSQAENINDIDSNWNKFIITKTKKNQQPLVPSVQYFNLGSSIFKVTNEKLIFDLYTKTKLGKYHSSVKLPSNAVSLLTNSIGCHLLTYASPEYQQRFMHNLYNTLWKAFIFENGRYSSEEMNNLLDMTIDFCNYMQHGISVVNYFINEYFSCFLDEHKIKLLDLIQWTSVSTSELQDYVLKNMHLTFYSSSIKIKCKIIKTLRLLMVNLSIINDQTFLDESFPFLGQSADFDRLVENFNLIDMFSKELITSGLNIHNYDYTLLSEALTFYEQISMLNVSKTYIVAPPAVVYGSFVTKSCAQLQRLSTLLLNYRKALKGVKDKNAMNPVHLLVIYAEDLLSGLWYDNCFKSRKDSGRHFLKNLSVNSVKTIPSCDINQLFNILNHYAVLPYLFMMRQEGLQINTKNEAMSIAAHYYSPIYYLIIALMGR